LVHCTFNFNKVVEFNAKGGKSISNEALATVGGASVHAKKWIALSWYCCTTTKSSASGTAENKNSPVPGAEPPRALALPLFCLLALTRFFEGLLKSEKRWPLGFAAGCVLYIMYREYTCHTH